MDANTAAGLSLNLNAYRRENITDSETITKGIPAARPLLTNPLPDLYAEAPETPQGWGLTMMLTNLDGWFHG
ncbi:MAG: hypothetical protein Q9172_004971 [Xanthocarpia lactea]